MKLYIPRIGEIIELSAPWQFDLFYENRNESVWMKLNLPLAMPQPGGFNYFGASTAFDPTDITVHNLTMIPREKFPPTSWNRYIVSAPVEFPTGTKLSIEKIQIRRGMRQFDSITFRVQPGTTPGFEKGKPKFWAKLDQVNTMECVDRV